MVHLGPLGLLDARLTRLLALSIEPTFRLTSRDAMAPVKRPRWLHRGRSTRIALGAKVEEGSALQCEANVGPLVEGLQRVFESRDTRKGTADIHHTEIGVDAALWR